MRKLRLVLPLALLLLVGTPALAQEGVLVFRADLSGAEEVPPHATDTTGAARFIVNQDRSSIEFSLDIRNGTDILGVAGAHLHCAPAGMNGSVIMFLVGSAAGGFDGRLEVRGTLNQGNVINASCGATLPEIVQSMRDGNVYVNVHSVAHPGGEVRGQLRQN